MNPISQYLLDGNLEQLVMSIAQMTVEQSTKRVTQTDILPLAVKQRHIQGNIIFTGLATNRPTDGSTEVQAYFATDTNALSMWNGTAWVSTTLS